MIERAVEAALESGARTADIVRRGEAYINTLEFTQTVLGALNT
jgi:isocitrate dehydrogenase